MLWFVEQTVSLFLGEGERGDLRGEGCWKCRTRHCTTRHWRTKSANCKQLTRLGLVSRQSVDHIAASHVSIVTCVLFHVSAISHCLVFLQWQWAVLVWLGQSFDNKNIIITIIQHFIRCHNEAGVTLRYLTTTFILQCYNRLDAFARRRHHDFRPSRTATFSVCVGIVRVLLSGLRHGTIEVACSSL